MPAGSPTRIGPRAITTAKCAVLVLLLAAMPWAPTLKRLDYFLTVERYTSGAIFALLCALCLVAFFVIPFVRPTIVRIPLVAIVLGGFAVDRVLLAVSGQGLDPNQAIMLWREKGMAGDAVAGYFWPVFLAASWLLPAAVILAWKPAPPATLRPFWAALPATALVGCFLVVRTTLGGTSEFPAPFAAPAMLAVAASSQQYAGPREDVARKPATRPHFRKIVMIVDESVRGDHLEINDAKRKSAPYLSSLGERLTNFGPAVAAHNCSAASRLILRTGLGPQDLPDVQQRALKGPAIWQFAKKAGFETVYIDAFVNVFGTHSYMMKAEHGFIDRKIPVGGNPVHIRDRKIAAEVLPGLLSGPAPVFVYVNKYGAHFPYRATYPEGFAADENAVARDDLADRAALVESYRRALRWSVDEFFRTLTERADLADTLILYTSDHGQSLLEGGYKLTHCSNGNVHPGEANVPIFALAAEADFGRALKAAAAAGFGQMTHFEIFPTLLLAMGYDRTWVGERYGPSLLDLAKEKAAGERRRFLTGDMFGVGRAPRWISMD